MGLVYLYSGQSLLREPLTWTWALPSWAAGLVSSVLPLGTYLRIQGAAEILMAFIFLAWFLKPRVVKFAALVSALEMAGILVLAFAPFNPDALAVSFRDAGLLGGALALVLIL